MALEQQVSRLTAENARLRDAVDGAIAQHLAARQQIEETRAELAASKENAHEWAATADRFCGQLMEAEKQVSRLTEAVEKLAALDDPPITPLHDARVVAGFYRGALLAILTPPPAARQSDDDEKTNNNQRGSK
jgi:DNA repair exonuclease SbcCD ATPase subunit